MRSFGAYWRETKTAFERDREKGAQRVIFVVGCNHGIQTADEDDLLPIDNIAEIRRQRLCFMGLLEAIVTKNQVQFLGEEWGLPQPSIARNLAEERSIAWANINTSFEDLDRMGIPRDYVHGPYGQAEKDRWNRQREEFMFGRVQENRGRTQNLLIVCGFRHLEPLRELFGQNKDEVQPVDYRGMEWYRRGVFCDDD